MPAIKSEKPRSPTPPPSPTPSPEAPAPEVPTEPRSILLQRARQNGTQAAYIDATNYIQQYVTPKIVPMIIGNNTIQTQLITTADINRMQDAAIAADGHITPVERVPITRPSKLSTRRPSGPSPSPARGPSDFPLSDVDMDIVSSYEEIAEEDEDKGEGEEIEIQDSEDEDLDESDEEAEDDKDGFSSGHFRPILHPDPLARPRPRLIIKSSKQPPRSLQKPRPVSNAAQRRPEQERPPKSRSAVETFDVEYVNQRPDETFRHLGKGRWARGLPSEDDNVKMAVRGPGLAEWRRMCEARKKQKKH